VWLGLAAFALLAAIALRPGDDGAAGLGHPFDAGWASADARIAARRSGRR
jgi:hypothetical protein